MLSEAPAQTHGWKQGPRWEQRAVGRPPGTRLPSHSPPRGAASGIKWVPLLRDQVLASWSDLSASLSSQGTFPKTASRVRAFPQALFQVASSSSSRPGREQPTVLATGEWRGAGARLPPWVFGGWTATKKSSNSLTVWLRISLEGSKGLVNQTWHHGKPWNPWGREAALPDRTASPAGSPQERPLGCCRAQGASGYLPGAHHVTSLHAGDAPEQTAPSLTAATGKDTVRRRKAATITRRSLTLLPSPES